MNTTEIRTFKELFSKFCREEINKGKCGDTDTACSMCPVDRAYEEIFDSLEGTDGDTDIDEDDEDSVPEPNEKFAKTS